MDETTLAVYKQAIRIMFSQQTPTDGLHELSAIARKLTLHPVWDKLDGLRLANEASILMNWIPAKVSSYKQNASILFFSLSDIGDTLSLIFLQKQRETETNDDWAAYAGNVFYVAPSKVLKRMYRLGKTELADGKGGYILNDARWVIETCYPLVYVGLTISSILRSTPSKSLLGVDTSRQVAIFFAEGDDFLFGEITETGFQQYNIPEFAQS